MKISRLQKLKKISDLQLQAEELKYQEIITLLTEAKSKHELFCSYYREYAKEISNSEKNHNNISYVVRFQHFLLKLKTAIQQVEAEIQAIDHNSSQQFELVTQAYQKVKTVETLTEHLSRTLADLAHKAETKQLDAFNVQAYQKDNKKSVR